MIKRRTYLSSLMLGAIGVPKSRKQDPARSVSNRTHAHTDTNASWSQQSKLAADDGSSGERFARNETVALGDGEVLIGVPNDETSARAAGSAYVFHVDGGTWTQQAKLTLPDGEAADEFGTAVALDGDLALISAPGEGIGGAHSVGVVYVFERSAGIWQQQTKLYAADRGRSDFFGTSVAIDGRTALVGAALQKNSNGTAAGAAYIFVQTDGTWQQEAKLVPDDGDAEDEFGDAVALSGETALIGAYEDDDPNGEDAGSAYVFTRTGGRWKQEAKLVADDGAVQDNFGDSVALDGDTALIGAWDNGPGSVYVFERKDRTWHQQAKLMAENGNPRGLFGWAVALEGDRALIGATGDDPKGDYSGSTYVFERTAGAWHQQRKLVATDGDSRDSFGDAVALHGRHVLIGAPLDEDPNGAEAGAAYIFRGPPLPGGPSVAATIIESGESGGQARISYQISEADEQDSIQLIFTTLPDKLTINQSASDFSGGTYSQETLSLSWFDPPEVFSVTVSIDISATAEEDESFTIEAALVDNGEATADSVQVGIGDTQLTLSQEYDVNNNGVIDLSEVRTGINDWAAGDLSLNGVRTLINAWADETPVR
jgi:hypothetical protein